jgi:predicted RNA polymerase sigma factor
LTRTTPDGCHGAVVAPGLVEHFFRHEYGRLVAVLTRTVGVRHLDVVEDAVQGALLTALTSWTAQGVPKDPGAWLYRVAYNGLIDDLRRKTNRLRILAQAVDPGAQDSPDLPPSYFAGEVADASHQ